MEFSALKEMVEANLKIEYVATGSSETAAAGCEKSAKTARVGSSTLVELSGLRLSWLITLPSC